MASTATSLGAAIRDDLSLVKDALDLELRTGEIKTESRHHSHEALLRLKDTLKMMGLNDSAQSIDKLMPAFAASEDPEQDPGQGSRETLLMGLAAELMRVESVLEEQIATLGEPLLEDQEPSFIDLPGHEFRRIRTHLLGETVVSLHQVQDGVRRPFDGDLKADYSTPMEHIAGAMELLGEPETASLASRTLTWDSKPQWTTKPMCCSSPMAMRTAAASAMRTVILLTNCAFMP